MDLFWKHLIQLLILCFDWWGVIYLESSFASKVQSIHIFLRNNNHSIGRTQASVWKRWTARFAMPNMFMTSMATYRKKDFNITHFITSCFWLLYNLPSSHVLGQMWNALDGIVSVHLRERINFFLYQQMAISKYTQFTEWPNPPHLFLHYIPCPQNWKFYLQGTYQDT